MSMQVEKSKRKNIKWSERMDRILVDTLVEEVAKGGKKPDNGWKPESLNHVVSEVKKKSGEVITHDNIKSRLKTVKKEYLAARWALDQSGFSIDPVTKCITADDDAWKRYIEAHPEVKVLADKPMKFYDSWQIIIGNEQATGDRAVEAHDFSPIPVEGETSSPSVQLPQRRSSYPTHPTKNRKRLRVLEGGISQGVVGMVEAANRLAATFEGPDWEKLNAAFEAIPELEEDVSHQAADLFNTNPWMARYFLSLSEGKRFGWLKLKLQL